MTADSKMTAAERAVITLAQICLLSIQESGEQGAPEGPMYLAFMQAGMSLGQFESMLRGLERIGKIRRSNHVCYAIMEDD